MVQETLTINGEPVIAIARWMFHEIRGIYITQLIETTYINQLYHECDCFDCYGYDFITEEPVRIYPFFNNGFWIVYKSPEDIKRIIERLNRDISNQFIKSL